MSNTMDTWFTSAASNQIRPTPFFKRILASKRAPLCMRSFLQNMLTSDIVIECIYYFINAQYNTPKFYGILSHGEDVAAHRLQRWQRSPPNRYQRRSFFIFIFLSSCSPRNTVTPTCQGLRPIKRKDGQIRSDPNSTSGSPKHGVLDSPNTGDSAATRPTKTQALAVIRQATSTRPESRA